VGATGEFEKLPRGLDTEKIIWYYLIRLIGNGPGQARQQRARSKKHERKRVG
jgi:hypothetical protein